VRGQPAARRNRRGARNTLRRRTSALGTTSRPRRPRRREQDNQHARGHAARTISIVLLQRALREPRPRAIRRRCHGPRPRLRARRVRVEIRGHVSRRRARSTTSRGGERSATSRATRDALLGGHARREARDRRARDRRRRRSRFAFPLQHRRRARSVWARTSAIFLWESAAPTRLCAAERVAARSVAGNVAVRDEYRMTPSDPHARSARRTSRGRI